MVLVDSSNEGQGPRLRAGWGLRRGTASIRRALWQRLRVPGVYRLAAETGLTNDRDDIASHYPPELAGPVLAVRLTGKARRTVSHDSLLLNTNVSQPSGLGSLPLTVLTAAGSDSTWMALQDELAQLSTCSAHVVAEDGGHNLNRDNPALVISVVRDLHSRLAVARQGPASARGTDGGTG
jgi:pimeloyl-ACP methyl ester carboxylesterase